MTFFRVLLDFPARASIWFVLAMVLYGAGIAGARAEEAARVSLSIGPTTLKEALQEFTKQSGFDVLFLDDQVAGISAPEVKGEYTYEEALRLLTAHSGLCVEFTTDRGGATVGKCQVPKPPSGRTSNSDSLPSPAKKLQGPLETAGSAEPIIVTVTGVMDVTGSNIRRRDPHLTSGPDPTVLTYQDLMGMGVTRLSDLDRILPEFFRGGPAQNTHLVGMEAKTNTGLGSAFNFRGVGAHATLLLINGRRLAPSGSAGSFVDNLNVPLSAIKKIEILSDGESAVYGADALAGVVNIITRDGNDPGETTMRAGAVTQGAWKEAGASQSLGNDWITGGAFAGVEYYRNTALPERDRGFGHSDLSANGGPDFDQFQSWPPNIVAGGQTWAVARGITSGVPLPSQLTPNSLNPEDIHSNTDLWPSQRIISTYGHVHQSVGDYVTLKAEGILTHRAAAADEGGDLENLTIPTTSQYYIGSIGHGDPMIVKTDLSAALGPKVTRVAENMMYEALTADIAIGSDSSISVGVSRALETEHQSTSGYGILTQLTNPAIGFDPFVVGGGLTATTLPQVESSKFFNQNSELHEYNVLWSGALHDRRSGLVSLSDPPAATETSETSRVTTSSEARSTSDATKIMGAVGLEYRTQTLRTADIITLLPSAPYDRRTKAIFAELRFPFGDKIIDHALPFEVTAAGRYEDYSDFGHAAVPRLAARWTIVSGLRLLASVGRSIRTPNLPDLNTSRNTITVPPEPPGVAGVIYLSGNSSGLQEEHATNAALELIYTSDPSDVPRIRMEAQLFSIDNYDRISSPDISNIGADLLSNPAYSSFVTRDPSLAYVAQLCHSPQLYGNITATQCLAGSYSAVVDLRLKNNDTLVTRGLDLQGTWSTPTSWGTLTVREIGTYIFCYTDKSTRSASFQSLLDTQNNPVNLQAHATVSATSHGFGAQVTTNFTNSYHDTASKPGRAVASWTTIDLQISYGFSVSDDRWIVALMARNIANRNPPFLINRIELLGYDEENADPLGRQLALELRKKW